MVTWRQGLGKKPSEGGGRHSSWSPAEGAKKPPSPDSREGKQNKEACNFLGPQALPLSPKQAHSSWMARAEIPLGELWSL